MKAIPTAALTLALCTSIAPRAAEAMCGFIAPQKPPNTQRAARIVNESSKVVMSRSGERTVITMANDVKGDVRSFALIIPVPTKITKEQVTVVGTEIFDQIEALTAPRVVETQDPDPCPVMEDKGAGIQADEAMPAAAPEARRAKPKAADYGVKVEAHFKVGEYDIAILSAKESDGLIRWLNVFKYNVPPDAADVLTSYLRQGMKFFVTRVDLKKQLEEQFTFLRPLQITYDTPKLMLPIRLGMLNADGKQELHLFVITDRGRAETTNYRTVKMHTGLQLPAFAMDELSTIYDRAFRFQSSLEGDRVVYQEFAGLPTIENWRQPWQGRPLDLSSLVPWWGKKQSFVTRLHFRYDDKNFPEDLQLQVTDDQANFAVRFPTRRPWRPAPGQDVCRAGETYLASLPARFEKEAKTLADFTGMDRQQIRQRLGLKGPVPEKLPEPPPPGKGGKDGKLDPAAQLIADTCGCSAARVTRAGEVSGLLAAFVLFGVLIGRRRRR